MIAIKKVTQSLRYIRLLHLHIIKSFCCWIIKTHAQIFTDAVDKKDTCRCLGPPTENQQLPMILLIPMEKQNIPAFKICSSLWCSNFEEKELGCLVSTRLMSSASTTSTCRLSQLSLILIGTYSCICGWVPNLSQNSSECQICAK